MKNRFAAAAVGAVVACMPPAAFAATGADAQYPARPVRIIVSSTPSGSTDIIARAMAQRLGERWGQTVVVDNRAGASGLIALELCARATPDLHTLTIINAGPMLTAQTSGKLSFKRGGDFTPIALSANTVLLLVAHPGVPAKSVKELVEFARAKPRFLNYASAGTGSMPHLGLALFAGMTGTELTHVPYKGSSLAYPDLLGGRVHLTLVGPSSLIQHVLAGRLRGLAITGAKRTPSLPDVPTFAEAGYPRYNLSVWYGVFAPARVSAPVVAWLNAELNWAVQQADVADRLTGAGIDPADVLSATQFADFVESDLITWNEALTAAGMQ